MVPKTSLGSANLEAIRARLCEGMRADAGSRFVSRGGSTDNTATLFPSRSP